jgi:hypothetical protein
MMFIKLLKEWQGGEVNSILMEACVASIPMFIMCILNFSKWAITNTNAQRTIYFQIILLMSINNICLIEILLFKIKN